MAEEKGGVKATLTFTLPEEKAEFDMAVKAGDYYSCLFELDQLWRRWKHSETEPTGQEVLDAIREVIHDNEIVL